MADFPRTVLPSSVTDFDMPGPLIAKSQGGRLSLRATQQCGRTWRETFLLNTQLTLHKNFLATVRSLWRNGAPFDLYHVDYQTPKGSLGGSPLINLASQIIGQPENLAHANWDAGGNNPSSKTSGQSDPFGGTAAYLVADNDATQRYMHNVIAFTGNGTKALAFYVKASTAGTTSATIFDETASLHRHQFDITWTAGVPSLSTVNGGGTLFPIEPVLAYPGWYRTGINATGVIAANANALYWYPAGSTAANTGDVYAFGFNAWNATVPMPYRSSTGVPVLTGDHLPLDGATGSVSNWLRAGDLASVPVSNLPNVFEVTSDTASQSDGGVWLPVNPPIYTGNSPVDNAVVTVTGVKLRACLIEPPQWPETSGQGASYGNLTCSFGETL